MPSRRRSAGRAAGQSVASCRSFIGASAVNLHALLRRQIELVARLDVERGIPGVEVAHGQRAILARRMAVGRDLLAERFLAGLLCPTLLEGDEEALVAG